MTLATRAPDFDTASHVATLERDGITALKGAFTPEWADRMREDMMTAFWAAIQRPGGAVGRGPRRWYVEVHPQDIAGFVDLVTHPWVVAMSEAVLGTTTRSSRSASMSRSRAPGTSRGTATSRARPTRTRAAGSPRCLQPHRRRRHRGHGPVRDRPGHAV